MPESVGDMCFFFSFGDLVDVRIRAAIKIHILPLTFDRWIKIQTCVTRVNPFQRVRVLLSLYSRTKKRRLDLTSKSSQRASYFCQPRTVRRIFRAWANRVDDMPYRRFLKQNDLKFSLFRGKRPKNRCETAWRLSSIIGCNATQTNDRITMTNPNFECDLFLFGKHAFRKRNCFPTAPGGVHDLHGFLNACLPNKRRPFYRFEVFVL